MIFDLKKFNDNTAVLEGDICYSYSDLYEMGERICESVPERSLVCLFTTNTIGSLAGYIAFLDHGIVPMMVDANTDPKLIRRLIEKYRPSFYWMPEAMADTADGHKVVFSDYGYILVDAEVEEPYELYPELAVLITTSGSTGSPKFVRQTYKNILSNTQSIVDYLGIDENDRAITTLPMNYVFGLSIIHTHLYAGASIVLTEENCYSRAFWMLFNDKQVTSISGVPFVYEMLDKLRAFKKPLPSLKTLTQAGGKLSKELQHKYTEYARDNDKRFIIMYGASEATARMAYLPFEYSLEKEGSIGIAIPGGRFELIDINGNIVQESHKNGELIYYGDNVTLGYAKSGEDLAKGDENHGRLLTGDIAYRDDDGFYYIAGRKKRFLKMLGKRVNLDEAEQLLKKHFNTTDVACAGTDDKLCIFVTDNELVDDMISYVSEITGINRGLCKVSVIDEIPKSASGKILYSELNKLL